MINIAVPGGRGDSGVVHNPYPEQPRTSKAVFVDRADRKRVRLYRKSLAEYRKCVDPPSNEDQAYSNLLNLSCQSVTVASKVFARNRHIGKRSSYKDGWSPTAMALKSQRIAILDILGHIQGTKRKKIWQSVYEQSVGILKIVKTWVKSVLKLWKSPKEAWDVMESTAYG
jgi:hypothetical protein